MGAIDADGLAAAGCDEQLIGRLELRIAAGDTDGYLRLLRAHRCELVEAMHEAQRPIDVCDWIIREVEAQHAQLGSGESGMFSTVASVCAGSTVTEGLTVAGTVAQNDRETAASEVDAWLASLQ